MSYRTGSERHAFKVTSPHASGGYVAGCRCGVELLVAKPGAPRKYRSSPADAWTKHNPDHVERPEPAEEVVGDSPGFFPPDAGARWTH